MYYCTHTNTHTTHTHTHTHSQRRLIALFNDITEISYQPDVCARGRLCILTHLADHPLIIRTVHLTDAMNMATLLDGYCKAFTPNKSSRLRNTSAAGKATPGCMNEVGAPQLVEACRMHCSLVPALRWMIIFALRKTRASRPKHRQDFHPPSSWYQITVYSTNMYVCSYVRPSASG